MKFLIFIAKSLYLFILDIKSRWYTFKTFGIALPNGAVFKCGNSVKIGKNFGISRDCEIYCQDPENGSQITFGDRVKLNSGVIINADSGGKIIIGNDVLIAHNVIMRASNHRFDKNDVPILDQGHTPGTIILEDDVWLGAGVLVMPDVKIRKGAIIGAGAVVTKDIPEYSIAVGVPARVIKKRNAKTR